MAGVSPQALRNVAQRMKVLNTVEGMVLGEDMVRDD
jgi:hypothetical protein